MSEEYKFFEHGLVKIEYSNYESRYSQIKCTVPNCLLQAVSPILLGAGSIENLSIMDPISIWIPKIDRSCISDAFSQHITPEEINAEIKNSTIGILEKFKSFSKILKNPDDLVFMLPVGIYVTFTYKVKVDSILKVMIELQRERVKGVPEFQWALAEILAQLIMDFERVAPLKSLPSI